MKEFLVPIFAVLLLSCIFNSVAFHFGLMQNMPPYPLGSNISEVKSSSPNFGCKRDDFCYPEINITNGKKPSSYITDITETGDRSSAEFPFGANN